MNLGTGDAEDVHCAKTTRVLTPADLLRSAFAFALLQSVLQSGPGRSGCEDENSVDHLLRFHSIKSYCPPP